MKTLFVVDDNDINLVNAENALSEQYNVITMSSAAIMFDLLDKITPDLILLDIMMPEMDGLEALRLLKSKEGSASIPVILLTSRNDAVTEARGFEMGAIDFISKPFSTLVLPNRIKAHLDIEGMIRERTEKLLKLQNGIVSVLANMVETRDKLTGRHIERTTGYINMLLKEMLDRGVYSDELKNWNLDLIVSSARLHDVGKIAVSDVLLNKPGRLTPEEFELIKTHTAEGEKIIDNIISESGDEVFLRNAKLFAGYHHERWDGTGYHRGLKGEEIPMQGRIMAIVDVYDALTSERPYKSELTHEEAVGIIIKGRNKHFDPNIINVFIEVCDIFKKMDQGAGF
ncbi:MAG: response regulator [Deltaproteobacteria bacterium]|nr:response regulator [Deltaproteobacteria bacterium]